MKFFKYASTLGMLKGLPRRNLNNIAYSARKYTDSIEIMDSPQVRRWMSAAEPDARVKRMTRMDQTRKVNHDALIDDLDMAGVRLDKSDREHRRRAESLAWEIKDYLKGRKVSQRRRMADPREAKKLQAKNSVNSVLAKAKALGVIT